MKTLHVLCRRLRTKLKPALAIAALLLLTSCGEPPPTGRAAFLLLDSSGTYTLELEKAKAIINYLLGTLDSGDSLAVALVNSGSFTEKNIIAKVTFDSRPSATNNQKRLFKEEVDTALGKITHGSSYTDITGGMLQAVQYLNETGAGKKYMFVFSDLKEDLQKGQIRDFPIALENVEVVALNVTKLRTDNIDPRDYLNRLKHWQKRVENGGGQWRVINDLENLESLVALR
jgi:hypothetical protein